MDTTAARKAAYYAAKAEELRTLAADLSDSARAEMLVVVAEYEKLASHWASIARMAAVVRQPES